MSSRPKYNARRGRGRKHSVGSIRIIRVEPWWKNFGWVLRGSKKKKKKKKRDDEANTLHDVLYVGGLSLVWIDKSILWKSDRRTDFYAWMTAVSIFNVDHFSLPECRFIVSSTCLLCIFQTICHVYSHIFLFFSFWELVVDTSNSLQWIEFLNLAIF